MSPTYPNSAWTNHVPAYAPTAATITPSPERCVSTCPCSACTKRRAWQGSEFAPCPLFVGVSPQTMETAVYAWPEPDTRRLLHVPMLPRKDLEPNVFAPQNRAERRARKRAR